MVSHIKSVFPEPAIAGFDISHRSGKKAPKINLKPGNQNQSDFPNPGNIFPNPGKSVPNMGTKNQVLQGS
jgi:hypothetical protein